MAIGTMVQTRRSHKKANGSARKAQTFKPMDPNQPQLHDNPQYQGENLRKLRQSHGMSQAELGWATGIEDKYISAIERGARSAGRKTVRRLSDFFEHGIRLERSAPKEPKQPDHIKLIHAELDKALARQDVAEQYTLAGRILAVLKEYRQAA